MADEQKTERVQLLMTPSEVRAVDDWSFEHRVRGRSEAIRQLIEFGIEASNKGKKMQQIKDVALWPSKENYESFRSVCDDEVSKTFEEFEALANSRITELERHGIKINKVSFDPELMAQWCRANFGKVDAEARRAYAGFIALSD